MVSTGAFVVALLGIARDRWIERSEEPARMYVPG